SLIYQRCGQRLYEPLHLLLSKTYRSSPPVQPTAPSQRHPRQRIETYPKPDVCQMEIKCFGTKDGKTGASDLDSILWNLSWTHADSCVTLVNLIAYVAV